jgi:hypothetical protein
LPQIDADQLIAPGVIVGLEDVGHIPCPQIFRNRRKPELRTPL